MEPWRLRPARDHGMTLGERFGSTRREPGLIEAIAQGVVGKLLAGYLRLGHRLVVTGREHLPRAAPFVMVANHASHLDALALATVLPWRLRRVTYLLAAGDVFFETPTRSLLSSLLLNALPMRRHSPVRHALADLRTRLREDACGLVLFPEGTRSATGAMGPFKPGLGMLVAGTDVPVVPCRLDGTFAAWPRQARLPRFRPIRVRIGPPLHFGEVPDTRDGWSAVGQRAEAAVVALGSG
ncbi:MAG: 1-acyl-sn-glycerol-3-phosphate acyltransferase [Planctomycetes bacterium]|nr:1-acyl-sn-glycerol-3-phosphate acyltransferase [Planctomycetota bacterium]